MFAKHRFRDQKVVDGPHDGEWEEISSVRQFCLKIRHILQKKLGGGKETTLSCQRMCSFFQRKEPTALESRWT